MEIEKRPINQEELQKIQSSIRLIGLLQEAGKSLNNRIVISGGYAVDGALGEITRPHSDIDIQVYGQNADAHIAVRSLFNQIAQEDPFFKDLDFQDKGRKEYYHNLLIEKDWLGVDIYYLQVAIDPFFDEKVIIKADGTHSKPQQYSRKRGKLEDVEFEIQEPLVEIVDKIYKREIRGDEKKEKHEQDIRNLQILTNAQDVKDQLENMGK